MDYTTEMPCYDGNAPELVTFCDSFVGPMFFSHSNADSVFSTAD